MSQFRMRDLRNISVNMCLTGRRCLKYLPEKTYRKLVDAIDNGTPLDREIADSVAEGMKKWAIEMGATHYTHWFHPLTEGTAEKHDALWSMTVREVL